VPEEYLSTRRAALGTVAGGLSAVSNATLGVSDTGGTAGDAVDATQPASRVRDIEVDISIDYLRKLGYYYVSMRVRYRCRHSDRSVIDWVNGTSGGPNDVIGLYWNPTEWDLNRSDELYAGMFPPAYGSWINGSTGGRESGTGFRIDNEKLCRESPETVRDDERTWSRWARCGVQLAPGEDHTDSSTVVGAYHHIWNDDSVLIGADVGFQTGVSLTGLRGSDAKYRAIRRDADGIPLKVDAADW